MISYHHNYTVRSSIITLTTDFGGADHYAGVMKGVIAGIHPAARIIDISHEISPCHVAHGAFVIAQTYAYFPPGTVHVVVVDPGVGGARRAILAEAGKQFFLAPDNGVLSQVYEREEHTVLAIDTGRFALQPMSQTFHGRDLFAPAAAWLSSGKEPSEFGDSIGDPCRLESTKPCLVEPGRWRGRVLNVDRFGNIVTSFPAALLDEASGGVRCVAGKLEAVAVASSYSGCESGEPFVIAGSSGLLEISINRGSAAELAGVRIGDPAKLVLI